MSIEHQGVAAVEADLIRHVSLLYSPPFGEVEEGPDAVWVMTGMRRPEGNGVLRARWDAEPDAVIARLSEGFRVRRLPMMWWRFTEPRVDPDGCDEALLRNGFRVASDRPAMTLGLADAPPASGLRWPVHRVRDLPGLRAWSRVVGDAFGIEDHFDGLSARSFARYGFGDEAPFRHYIVSDGDAAVGAATLSLGAGVAGLGNIATLPSHRRRGIATAAITQALADALSLGLSLAALSADRRGDELYRRLGFEPAGRHLTYERPAP